MIDSVSLRWLCTVAFAAIGAYYLVWLLRAPGGEHRERVSNAAHLAMCAAMILMVWPWGMDVAVLPQQVVFGLAAVWFLVPAVRTAPAGHRWWRLRHGQHAVLMAAMVWMLATLPSSMAADHSGHTMNMSAMPAAGMPTYQTVITLAVGIYCLASALTQVGRRANASRICQGAMSAGMGALLLVMV